MDVAAAVVRNGGRALVASAGGRLESELVANGGRAFPMPLDSKNPLTMMANAGRLERLIRAEGVHLVHVRSRAPAFSAIRAARRAGVQVVTTYHGIYTGGSSLKRWYNGVMTRGDLTIANSEFTREHLIREHGVDPDRVVTIPRGVDLARFDPAVVTPERLQALRTAWGIGTDERRLILLLAGRLTSWKGQGLMIETLARLKAQTGRDEILLILAGDDQGRSGYTEHLHRLIAESQLVDAVRIVGHVSDMPAAYLVADAAVAPSFPKPEAFGRTAVEPQAMGRPVLGVGPRRGARDHRRRRNRLAGEAGRSGRLDPSLEHLDRHRSRTPHRHG